MEGMIFAAGLGTRLRPLTNDRPKALVTIHGKTLLQRVIDKMVGCGIKRIVINIHHFADLMVKQIAAFDYPGVELIISDERDLLLDTGGGLLKARSLFSKGEPVLIHNVDIDTELDLRHFISDFETSPQYAVMVTKESQGGRVLKFDESGVLRGWTNLTTGEVKISGAGFYEAKCFSFCGIQIVSASFMSNMSGVGAFSIIDEYVKQAARFKIYQYNYDGPFMDLGTPEAIALAEAKV